MSLIGRLQSKAGIFSDGVTTIFNQPIIANGGITAAGGRGKVIFADAANGNDNNGGKTPREAVKTIAEGYSRLTANQHDTLVLISGASSFTISDGISWTKSYTHMIGLAAPTPNSRARLSSTHPAPFIVTADGCRFENFRLFQGSSNLVAQGLWVEGANRNYFRNLSIHGQAHATPAAYADAGSLFINGSGENRFDLCEFGLDTVVKTAGYVVNFDGASPRNEFLDCRFVSACETADIAPIQMEDTAALDRSTLFKNCLFYNFWTNHVDKLNQVFSIPASAATHDIILFNCAAVGFDQWAANDRGSIWVIGGTPAAGTAGSGSTGIAVEPS